MGDTHAALERGLQREFENTESNGISVWLKQLKPLLMSETHGASRLELAHKWVFKPLFHCISVLRSCFKV